jgi:hypothetical protein
MMVADSIEEANMCKYSSALSQLELYTSSEKFVKRSETCQAEWEYKCVRGKISKGNKVHSINSFV